jgi:hypothetical protein
MRLHFGLVGVGALGVAASAVGRATGSDPMIALGIPGGVLLLVGGLSFRFNYRAVATEYESWGRSRGRAISEGTGRRLGLAYMFAGVVFAISAAVGLSIY